MTHRRCTASSTRHSPPFAEPGRLGDRLSCPGFCPIVQERQSHGSSTPRQDSGGDRRQSRHRVGRRQALAHEGVRVVGAARTITAELEKVTVAAVSADLATAESATAEVDAALAEVGGIDIVINNVGAGDVDRFGLGGFLDIGDEQ